MTRESDYSDLEARVAGHLLATIQYEGTLSGRLTTTPKENTNMTEATTALSRFFFRHYRSMVGLAPEANRSPLSDRLSEALASSVEARCELLELINQLYNEDFERDKKQEQKRASLDPHTLSQKPIMTDSGDIDGSVLWAHVWQLLGGASEDICFDPQFATHGSQERFCALHGPGLTIEQVNWTMTQVLFLAGLDIAEGLGFQARRIDAVGWVF